MKFFTPELYTRLQASGPDEMDAADAAWEQAADRYDQRLRTIRPALPDSLRHLLEDYYLHDADVLTMGREGHTFVMALQLETPPRKLLIITYTLAGEPIIEPASLPPEHCSPRVQWLCDEIDLVDGEKPHFTHDILLSNGWHVQLSFRDVHVVEAQALLPRQAPVSAMSQPA
jgi:hypothetical protein